MRSPKGNMIQENNYIKKLRRTKPSGKRSDVFSCLTSNPTIPKPIEVPLKDIDLMKIPKRFLTFEQRQQKKKLTRNLKVENWQKEYDVLITVVEKTKGQRRRFKKLSRRLGYTPKKIRKPRDFSKSKRKRKPSKYDTYINSSLWTTRKNRLFQVRPRICEVCASTSHITVHHLRYESKDFGNEPDSDLAILCWKCHQDFHKEYGVSKECHKEYELFNKSYTHP